MPVPICLVSEDAVSEFIMTKLVESFGDKYFLGQSYGGNGFGYIKVNINGFNQASMGSPFFVLTDLDQYDCAPALINEWLTVVPAPNLIFRVAVKEVEAWLLADIDGLSTFLGIARSYFSDNPEADPNPKQTLIDLARRSRKRSVREDIVPLSPYARVGPNYNHRLMQFISSHWSVERASVRAPSLAKAYQALAQFDYIRP